MNAVLDSEQRAPPVPAVARAVLVLHALGEDDRGRRLSELSRELGVSKSTLSGLLSTLEQFGLVERDPDSRVFRLGMGLLDLGGAVLRRLDLRELARPSLRRLAEMSNETAILHLRDGDESVIADRIEPRRQLKVVAPLGHRLPPFAGSVAKAILATLPDREAAALLASRPLPAFTPRSITTADRYLAELARVREVGYALEDDEYLDGVCAVSAAIVDAAGHAVATVSVAAVGARVTGERIRVFGPAIAAVAQDVSRRLGARMEVT
ncbi:MAG TPA: IclR family transcriptional regulator [Gaiellaceae bacterium]|nr:IclR family transcriptional regulator [Gaiellaceae bacterium]